MNNIDSEDRRKQSVVERHFTSVMSMVILAAVLGVASNIYSQGIKQAELIGIMNALEIRVGHLKEAMSEAGDDRYKGKDARKDKKQLDLRLSAERVFLMVKLEAIEDKFSHCHRRVSHIEDLISQDMTP